MSATGLRIAVWAAVGLALVLAGCGNGRSTSVDPAMPHVVVVSVDGLRPDAIAQLGPAAAPTFHRLIAEGVSTGNARTDFDQTVTLPNHLSMLTGRPVAGTDGHGLVINDDDGGVIHGRNPALPYVASVFDVVHDRGGSTALYVSKPKLALLDRSWDSTNGAADLVGEDDGADKIDAFILDEGSNSLMSTFVTDMSGNQYNYSMVHLKAPDEAGHDFGWMSDQYLDAVRSIDVAIGELVSFIEGEPSLADDTFIIVTSDHGGIGSGHADPGTMENYTIPLYVFGNGIEAADLYVRNPTTRLDPGTGQPGPAAAPPPIRNGDVANLALDLLRLPPIPGAPLNGSQDLKVGSLVIIQLTVFNPDTAQWDLLLSNGRRSLIYFGRPGDVPLLGDWDCDGVETPGVYRRSSGVIHLTNRAVTGVAEHSYFFGGLGDVPVAGDWDGDECDTVAVYRDGEVFINNTLTTRPAEFSFYYGRTGDLPFAGDFNGSGSDSFGVRRPGPGKVFLRNSLTTGPAEVGFHFGSASDLVVAGDWDGDRLDTVGVYRPGEGRFFLTNQNQTQEAEIMLGFGDPGGLPAAGSGFG